MNLKLILPIIILLLLQACGNKKTTLTKKISDLEQSDSCNTPSGMKQLAKMYSDYALSFPKDSISKTYLFKAFIFNTLQKQNKEAISLAHTYLSKYKSDSNYKIVNIHLAQIYALEQPNIDSAIHYYSKSGDAMQGSDWLEYAKVLEAKYKTDSTNVKHSYYLYKAAQCVQAASGFDKSIELFKKLIYRFPNDEKVPASYFTIGFIYWNDLKNDSKAKESYQKLISQFPDHELSKQAKLIISNYLGKSDEQILESF